MTPTNAVIATVVSRIMILDKLRDGLFGLGVHLPDGEICRIVDHLVEVWEHPYEDGVNKMIEAIGNGRRHEFVFSGPHAVCKHCRASGAHLSDFCHYDSAERPWIRHDARDVRVDEGKVK